MSLLEPSSRRDLPLSPGRWASPVLAGLRRMLAEVRPTHGIAPVAAFDFDDTCLAGDISHAVLEDLDEEAPGLVDAYVADCAVDLRSAYVRLVGTLVGGRKLDEVRALTRRALERRLADGRLALVPEMQELIGALGDHGWEVWIVTASPEPLVQELATAYGLAAERVIGMRSPVGADGCFTLEVLEPITYKEGKLQALRQITGRDPVFAAGDSGSDRDLLGAARFGLLIDRGDEDLRAEAARQGWWIQSRWS